MKRNFIQTFSRALYQATVGKSKSEIETIVDRAVEVLNAKGLTKKSTELFKKLAEAHRIAESIVIARVTTANPLSSHDRTAVVELVTQRVDKHASVEIEEIIDPSVIGGFVVRYGDTVIDASLHGAIKQLSSSLIN